MAQFLEQLRDICGFVTSEGIATVITNKLLSEIKVWLKQPLSTLLGHGPAHMTLDFYAHRLTERRRQTVALLTAC